MKQLNTILLFTFLLLTSISLKADVFTWIGGNGDWDENSNWDLGDVPSYEDGVIIPSGTVTINNYANVNYIHLHGGNLVNHGLLYVEPNIQWAGPVNNNVDGIYIESGSSFDNHGNTIIIQKGNVNLFSHLIFCNGTMVNHSSGYIFLQGDESTGIHSYTLSNTIDNYGEIYMSFIKTGLYLIKPFRNYGEITIQCEDLAISCSDSFYSGSGATLNSNGRITVNSGATWIEAGDMDINYVSTSNASVISIVGTMDVKTSGSLIINGSFSALNVSNSGTFRVRGDLEIANTKQYSYALINNGFMVNHQKGIINTAGYYGIINSSGAQMLNYGIWTMKKVNYRAFKNTGSFSNRPKGKLYIKDRLELTAGSTFNNQGHMFVQDDHNHISLIGNFNNTGTLNDVYDLMSSISNNTSYRVHLKSQPIIEGVPFLNVLDKGNNPGTTVLAFYTTATGSTSAGTYNSAGNSFTPNSNAVGLTSVYVRTRINAGGVTRRHELIFENGILENPNPLIQNHTITADALDASFSVFPNPIQDNYSIEVRSQDKSQFGFSLYNASGQKVSSGILNDNSGLFELPRHLHSGIYFLRVTDQDGISIGKTKKVRVIR